MADREEDIETRLEQCLTIILGAAKTLDDGLKAYFKPENYKTAEYLRLVDIEEFLRVASQSMLRCIQASNEHRSLNVIRRKDLDALQDNKTRNDKVLIQLQGITEKLDNLKELRGDVQNVVTGAASNPQLVPQEVRSNLGALLKPLPYDWHYEHISNPWDTSRSLSTTVWGYQHAVKDFSAAVSHGLVFQLGSVGSLLEIGLSAVQASLSPVCTKYDVHPSTIDPAAVIRSAEYLNLVQEHVAFMRESTAPPYDESDVAAYRAKAHDSNILTPTMITLLLSATSIILSRNTDKNINLGPGVCVRSAMYGGYRLLDADGTYSDFIWLGNVGCSASNELNDDWNFGSEWHGFALPGALGPDDSEIGATHIIIKRKLNDFVDACKVRTSGEAFDPEDFQDKFGQTMLRPGSRIEGRNILSPEMSENRFRPGDSPQPGHKRPAGGTGTPHGSSITISQHHNRPEPNTPFPQIQGTGKQLRNKFSMRNLKSKVTSGKNSALAAIGRDASFNRSATSHSGTGIDEEDEETQEPNVERVPPLPQSLPGDVIAQTASLRETHGDATCFYIGPISAASAIPKGLLTNTILRYLSRAADREVSVYQNITLGQPVCVAAVASYLRTPTKSRNGVMFNKTTSACNYCPMQDKPSQCVFYVGDNQIAINQLYLNDYEIPEELSLQYWSDEGTFLPPDTATVNQAAAPQFTRPIGNQAPAVPAHFGDQGQLVYVGAPPEVDNANAFDERVIKALKTSPKAGGRTDHGVYRRQCMTKNSASLSRCMATYLTKAPAAKPDWSNTNGPCDECEDQGRQCVVMVDMENAWIMGTGKGSEG